MMCKEIYFLLVARPGFTRGQLFVRISTFKPSLNNYESNDIFLRSVEPFSSFSEIIEQHLIFINIEDR